MDSYLVSAIITTHNRPPSMVLRAVNSVLNQTYYNIELIVVDDSNCDFPERIDVENAVQQASEKIQYIKHTNNKGGCAARNSGLMQSKGYFVAFLDDDDEWLPQKIEEQIKGFIDNNIALVYCTYNIINLETGEKYIKPTQFRKGRVFNDLLKNNFIGGTSNPLIKKECIEKVGGFDEIMESSQDYDLWLRLSQHYSINYIEKPLLNYYIHAGERISTNAPQKIAGIERIIKKYSEYLNRNKNICYLKHMSIVPYYLETNGRKKAFSLWIKNVTWQPFRFVNNLRYLIIIVLGNKHYLAIVARIKRVFRLERTNKKN